MTPARCQRALAAAAPALRVVAGGVLAVSGYLKAVRPPEEFAASLEAYWFLPVSLLMPLARGIPWVELLTGLALVAGYGTRRAAGVAAALYLSFVVVLGQSLLRGLHLAGCGCFGRSGPQLTPAQALTMDAVLFLFSLAVLADRERRWSVDRWTGR